MNKHEAKRDVAAEVTAKIVAALEAGTAPWIRPWKSGVGGSDLPSNVTSGRTYSGINVLLLWAAAFAAGFSDSRWLTFNQAKGLGGSVRKGEKGTQIVFWKWLVVADAKEPEGTKRIALARTFTVFNVAQCDGLELDAREAAPEHVTGAADLVAERVGASVSRGGDRACYVPALDAIQIPVREAFETSDAYEGTLLHELSHWTGHETRLDRKLGRRFGQDAYAAEELIAELSSAFCCARLGIAGQLQHAEYIASWAKVLRADKHAIFTAAREATRAANLLVPETSAEEEEEAA